MKTTRIILTILVLGVFGLHLQAQDEQGLDPVDDNILLRKEMNGAIFIHNNGWGLEYRIGKNRTITNKTMFEFDLLEYKHSKEIKSINPFFTNTRSYIYGKLNAVYMVRAGIGEQRILNRKPYSGGVELRLYYFGGLSMAVTKPVYLNILEFDTIENRNIIMKRKYDPDLHFPENIFGRASFLKGFNELTPYPGAYFKTALGIEFGTLNQSTKLVEVGAVIDAFAKPIPIMATRKADRFFVTIYISAGIGKRYD